MTNIIIKEQGVHSMDMAAEKKPGVLTLGKKPSAPPEETELSMLEYLIKYGFKQQSFHFTTSIVAPEEINDKGSSYDAGEEWDSWVVIPSIDCKVSFEGPPSSNTPFVTGKTSMNFEILKQKVWYQSENQGQTGKLSIWLARY